MSHTAINPTTGETIATHADLASPELRRAIAATQRAYLRWQQVPMQARADLMRTAARLLRERAASFAELMARDGEAAGPGTRGSGKVRLGV